MKVSLQLCNSLLHPELRKAVQTFIKFDVESGGRPSARALFQEAKGLLLYASSPHTILETSDEASTVASLPA